MTTKKLDIVEQIVKHPAVSAVYANGPKITDLTDNVALQALCRLRRMRRNAKQATQNAREDVAAIGHTDSPARMPAAQYQAQQLALAADNAFSLPNDLAELVLRAALYLQDQIPLISVQTRVRVFPPRNTLITNIGCCDLNGVRLWVHALLIEGSHGGSAQHMVRGFSYNGAVPVFTYWLQHYPYPYTLNPAKRTNVMVMTDSHPEPQELFQGATLSFPGSEVKVEIVTENHNHPFDVFDHDDIDVIWSELVRRVAKYWCVPNIPVCCFVPVDEVRSKLNDGHIT